MGILADIGRKLKKGLQGFVDKIRVGGLTILEALRPSTENTTRQISMLWKRAVMSDMPLDDFQDELAKLVKRRKQGVLGNLKNILSGVRGAGRSFKVGGKKGQWFNVGVLDSAQTKVCSAYMGKRWKIPYSQIPDKPPRISKQYHRCRSYLEFVEDGSNRDNFENGFLDQFDAADERSKKSLLGSKGYDYYIKHGRTFKSFAEYEKAVLLD